MACPRCKSEKWRWFNEEDLCGMKCYDCGCVVLSRKDMINHFVRNPSKIDRKGKKDEQSG